MCRSDCVLVGQDQQVPLRGRHKHLLQSLQATRQRIRHQHSRAHAQRQGHLRPLLQRHAVLVLAQPGGHRRNGWYSLEPDCAGNAYYTHVDYDCQPVFYMCSETTVVHNIFSGNNGNNIRQALNLTLATLRIIMI